MHVHSEHFPPRCPIWSTWRWLLQIRKPEFICVWSFWWIYTELRS